MGERVRRAAPIAAIAIAVLVLAVWWARGPRIEAPPAKSEAPGAPALPSGENAAPSGELRPAVPPMADAAPQDAPAEDGDAAMEDEPDEQDAIATAWANVDLEAVRRAMPDNLYFKMSAPTQDEAVEEERRKERDRWNTEFGKILSGTGTDEEITAFYDERARLATDYVEFTTYLLDHYRDTLTERDVSLLELARTLNAARLEEIPRKVEEAFERKRQQDQARAAWLAGERDFQGDEEQE